MSGNTNHPTLAQIDANISIALYAASQYDYSLVYIKNALRINEKYYGSKSLKVAACHHLVARCLVRV